jgi:hypothetical protein
MKGLAVFKKYKNVNFLKYFFVLFCCILCSQVAAQSGSIRQVEKKMEEGDWKKSRQLINKLLDKDSLNLEARLILSKWFLAADNPGYQFDSAYRQTRWALHHYKDLSIKQKERLKKESADSVAFGQWYLKMDSLAFEQSKNANSEEAYQKFLRQFPTSIQKDRAIELRDEVAFLNALKANTYFAFEGYLKKYPQSARRKDATQRYDQLLFENKTKDKKLRSYESFAEEFPQSPFWEDAVKNIFQIKTSSGLPQDFNNFISKYSLSKYVTQARDILQYLAIDGDETQQVRFETDSSMQMRKLNSEPWIPVYKNGKYGFMNEYGVMRIPPRFEKISSEYFCGNVKEEILNTSEGLLRRNGKIIFKSCAQVKDLGSGFLLAGDSIRSSVVHKSGRVVDEMVESASVLDNRFLILTKGESQELVALNGRVLIPFQKQLIEMKEGLLIVGRYGKKILFRVDQVIASADGILLKEEFVFDDAKPAGHHLVLVRNGALEGLMNDILEFVVPLGRQALQPTSFGLLRKMEDQFMLSGLNAEIESQSWKKYKVEKQWLLLQNDQASWLTDLHTKTVLEKKADSIWLDAGLAFVKVKDSVRVYLNSKNRISLPSNSTIAFMKSTDSVRYFYSQQRGKKVIYDVKTGAKKLTLEGDQVESIGDEYFLVTKRNKKGLLSKSAKSVLSFEYDAVLVKKDAITLLKDKKFGLYQISSGKLIKPTYSCNLTPLDSIFLIACKNDLFGIIDLGSKPITPFEFSEIRPWGNHLIWVKRNFDWSLMNYVTGKTILSKIKNYVSVKESVGEQIAIVQQENFYGVVSNAGGVIIQPTFSYVANVGSAEHPLYFTSKEVEEAGVFVVIYYDKAGQLLRKDVYEEDEYEKIVCKED